MTPAQLIPSSLPDLRTIPLGEQVGPAALEEVLRRALPRKRPVAVVQAFGSAI